jgi:hypothetical protein
VDYLSARTFHPAGLTNDDIIDLYNRTPIGTKVLVLATAYNASGASGIVAAQQR